MIKQKSNKEEETDLKYIALISLLFWIEAVELKLTSL